MLLSYDQAIHKIDNHPLQLANKVLSLDRALGHALAGDVFAPIDLPPFDNSAVDGFAINTDDLGQHSLKILGEIRARASLVLRHQPRACMRVMTGAPIPVGADAVVMKEDVDELHGAISINKAIKGNDNIRKQGEDITIASLAASSGTMVTPQLIALFAGLGMSSVTVRKPPSVAIISTGDELQNAGEPLQYGQVYSLMGSMLRAQCAMLAIDDVTFVTAQDDCESIMHAIKENPRDITLITGGMSKGEYDLVRPAMKELDVREIFFEGAFRPGKPLFFGAMGERIIFGLPGNPVAAFVSFHVFVRTLIEQAYTGVKRRLFEAKLVTDVSKKPGFTHFMRAFVNERREIEIFSGQGSHQLHTLSMANALCVVPEQIAIVKAGQTVHYYPL